jgi:peptidoglycan/LPS O-acetylase OafA/YrhL
MEKLVKNTQKPSFDLTFLDGLRGFSALYVVIGHARWLLWEGYTSFQNHAGNTNLLYKIQVYFWSFFKFGHQAVLFFFILSGFLIHLKYSRIILSDPKFKFDFEKYFTRRAKRIFPPLLFALILTLVLDYSGGQIFYFSKIYAGQTPYPLINNNISNNGLSFIMFFQNLCFLMPFYVKAFGTNGPLWSLGYEWWFYIFYPIFYYLTRKSLILSTIIMVLLWGASFYPAYWPATIFPAVFSMMLAWWFGALLADVYTGRINVAFKNLIPLVLLLPLSISSTIKSDNINDILTALGFIGLVSCFFMLKEQGREFAIFNKFKWLGDCSYSLYVTHFPILVIISGYLIQNNEYLPANFFIFYGAVAFAVLFAWAVHFLIEKPFVKKR